MLSLTSCIYIRTYIYHRHASASIGKSISPFVSMSLCLDGKDWRKNRRRRRRARGLGNFMYMTTALQLIGRGEEGCAKKQQTEAMKALGMFCNIEMHDIYMRHNT